MTKEHEQIRSRYLERLAHYCDPPRGVEAQRYAEHELAAAEHALLDNPPPCCGEDGIWRPRAKGLITTFEARAGATADGLGELEVLEMPKGPRYGDAFKLYPEREWDDVFQQKKKDEALNKPLIKFVLDQNGDGSCASDGYSGNLMFCEQKQGQKVELLNPLGLYGLVNGGRDQGSSLSDNIAAGALYGVPSEAVWPRSNGWRKKLSDDARHDALRHRADEVFRIRDKAEYACALLDGFLVYSAYPGHAWVGVEYRDRTRFDWLNSWGRDFADGGFSTMRYSSIAWGHGAWAFRTSRRAA